MKKIAVIASGWHFPSSFYEAMVAQVLSEDWKVDYFCIAHRDPAYAMEEKKNDVFADDVRGKLDKKLYKEIASKWLITALGWNYKEYPNTIGDWGNANQWLEEHDYTEYDLILITHDDNLILNNRLFIDTIEDPNYKKWGILTNSSGMPPGTIRGSFEFFKPSVLKKMGGRFDTSFITLTREGITTSSNEIPELYDWNKFTANMAEFVEKNRIKVAIWSPGYRFSAYVLEGERGYISKTHGENTKIEDYCLTFLKQEGLI